jgi:hypothetical protein
MAISTRARRRQASCAVPAQAVPNILLLTVGHTGSTVIAGLFAEIGWNLPDNDAV